MPDVRWKFYAFMDVLSPLHIGDGTFSSGRLQGMRVEESPVPDVASVCTGYDQTPVIPGSTLKGWLRGIAADLIDQPCIDLLFGKKPDPNAASDLDRNGCGGIVRFLDGRFMSAPSEELLRAGRGIYWHEQRKTCVASHVVINRKTRTAAHELLFFEEFVPAGSVFEVELELRRCPGADDSELLMAFTTLMDSLTAGEGSEHFLGSGYAAGNGRVRLRDLRLERLSSAKVTEWLNADIDEGLPYEQIDWPSQPALGAAAASTRHASFDLCLKFTGAFVSHDPSRARRPGDPLGEEGNLTPLRDCEEVDGPSRPVLPATSLRGRLRPHAEYICRSAGWQADGAPIASPDPAPGEPRIPTIRNRGDIPKLDLVSLLFGATGWRSPLRVDSIRVKRAGDMLGQEHVAIDRFTGGVAGDRKFSSRYFWKPSFQVRLSVDQRRLALGCGGKRELQEQAWSLFALTLRDLCDGWVPLGADAAKGFGACTGTLKPVMNLPDNTVLEEGSELRDFLQNGYIPEFPEDIRIDDNIGTCGEANNPEPGLWNPYHFTPVTAPAVTDGETLADLKADAPGMVLDRTGPGLLTGYFDCLLTTETPLVVGAIQTREPGSPAEVENFRRDSEIAIPATSLRGMISSQFEALTNSSMRVLRNEFYSVRKLRDDALPCIGMLVKRRQIQKWYIYPIAVSPSVNGQYGIPAANVDSLPPAQYIGTYADIRNQGWLNQHKTWTPTAVPGGGIANEQPVYRSLGCVNGRQMPPNKYHELLLPISIAELNDIRLESEEEPEPRLLEVADEVVESFHLLADQVTAMWRVSDGNNIRPYEPYNTREPRLEAGPGGRPAALRLKAGDLVYCNVDVVMNQTRCRTTELAFSAIWRKRVDGKTFDFFGKVSPDLLPLSDQRRGSRPDEKVPVTPAEKLFGFVEMRERSDRRSALKALASRVRFSDARYTGNAGPEPILKPVKLKILSSPKPPSPALYFSKPGNSATAQYIAPTDLKFTTNHEPNGRKFYLHRSVRLQTHNTPSAPWASQLVQDDDQKLLVTPVKADATFRFRVYFENLRGDELRTLHAALRPSASARYKLGLGKPLGLGTVRLSPSNSAYVLPDDKEIRYDSGYLGFSLRERMGEYLFEPLNSDELAAFLPGYTAAWKALHEVKYPHGSVGYPRVQYQGPAGQDQTPALRAESKLYEWFVANNAGSGGNEGIPAQRTALMKLEGVIQKLPVPKFIPPG